MAKIRVNPSSETQKRMRPALTPEARENQLISLAVDCAEKQLRDGTASSQVIVHYLKLGSTREKLDHELKLKELELMAAKTENLKSMKKSEELMEEAIRAFRMYNGHGDQDDED